jgi:hypothetical protein
MAAAHGRKAASVIDTLLGAPSRFSLAQAMRLLTLELEAGGIPQEEIPRQVHIMS